MRIDHQPGVESPLAIATSAKTTPCAAPSPLSLPCWRSSPGATRRRRRAAPTRRLTSSPRCGRGPRWHECSATARRIRPAALPTPRCARGCKPSSRRSGLRPHVERALRLRRWRSLRATVVNVMARVSGSDVGSSRRCCSPATTTRCGPGPEPPTTASASPPRSRRRARCSPAPRPRRDVWLLIDDGEEQALLGAEAFVREAGAREARQQRSSTSRRAAPPGRACCSRCRPATRGWSRRRRARCRGRPPTRSTTRSISGCPTTPT